MRDGIGKMVALGALVLLVAAGCRKKEVAPARIAIENNYSVVRLMPIEISAGVSADSYRWVVDSVRVGDNPGEREKKASAMRDSTVSESSALKYTFDAVGIYHMTCRMGVDGKELAKSFRVHVIPEFLSFKDWAKVTAYSPALGEFIVTKVGSNETLEGAMNKANLNFRRGNKNPLYLGSFGGNATFEFDHAVQNFSDAYDFEVVRDTSVDGRYYGRADVVVWVSQDGSKWYRLRSAYDSIPYSGRYSVGPKGAPVEGDKTGFSSDDAYVWSSSTGSVNIPVRSSSENLVPGWIKDTWLSTQFDGFLLQRQCRVKAHMDPADPTVLVRYEMTEFRTRAYNEPPAGEKSNVFGMDIDWAVDDATGQAVKLKSIQYVRVATGVLEAPKTWRLLESSVIVVRDLGM